MRIILRNLVLGGLILSCNAYAIDTTILGKEPGTGPTNEAKSESSSGVQMRSGGRWEELSLSLRASRIYSSYEASAGGKPGSRDGYTQELPVTGGLGYGATIKYRPTTSWYSLFARYNRRSTPYDDVNTSPAQFDVTHQTYSLGFMIYPFSRVGSYTKLQRFSFGFGLTRENRDTAETKPNTVVTVFEQLGPFARVAHELDLAEDWTLDSSLSFFLPFKYLERNTNSGYFGNAWSAELEVSVTYRLTQTFGVSLGAFYSLDRTNYQGLGRRAFPAVTNVAEDNRQFGFPVELKLYL